MMEAVKPNNVTHTEKIQSTSIGVTSPYTYIHIYIYFLIFDRIKDMDKQEGIPIFRRVNDEVLEFPVKSVEESMRSINFYDYVMDSDKSKKQWQQAKKAKEQKEKANQHGQTTS
jgi:hypothetical protein